MVLNLHDIHCHILPYIDDGAKDMNESIRMAAIASENGIQSIIATPHYIEGLKYNNALTNQIALEDLNKELIKRGICIKILLGNEVFITQSIFDLIQNKEITTLNKSRYVLIELPRTYIPIFIRELIHELRTKGIIPIIAHPERNLNIIDDVNILNYLLQFGALAQLNLSSIVGRYGDAVSHTARKLLAHDMIQFISGDAHTSRGIMPNRAKVSEIISNVISEKQLDKLLYLNPQKVIEDEIIKIDKCK